MILNIEINRNFTILALLSFCKTVKIILFDTILMNCIYFVLFKIFISNQSNVLFIKEY